MHAFDDRIHVCSDFICASNARFDEIIEAKPELLRRLFSMKSVSNTLLYSHFPNLNMYKCLCRVLVHVVRSLF